MKKQNNETNIYNRSEDSNVDNQETKINEWDKQTSRTAKQSNK